MKSTLRRRLQRLEAAVSSEERPAFLIGVLKRLPDDYRGERHVVIAKADPNNPQPYAFEERPGPAPAGSDDGIPRIFLTEDESKI